MMTKQKNYSVKEAARELNVTEQTVRSYLKEGELKGSQIGKKKKWSISDAELTKFKKKYGYENIGT
jgi:excisionase family DNA binding protein